MFRFILTLVLLLPFFGAASIDITIQGSGVSNLVPMGNLNYHVSEHIYRASEFGITGTEATFNLDYIGFNLQNLAGSGNYQQIRVSLKVTSDSAFTTSSVYTDQGYLLVYDGPMLWLNTGWETVNFQLNYSIPIPNNPNTHIQFLIERFNPSGSSSNTFSTANGFTGANGLYSSRSYQSNQAPLLGSSVLLLSAERPSIRFGGYPIPTLSLRTFVQSYYEGNYHMPSLLHYLSPLFPPSLFDVVGVELRKSAAPYTLLASRLVFLDTAGFASIPFHYSISSDSVQLSISHRNSIGVCASQPMLLDTASVYDFSLAASQAYGSNQAQIGPGVYALYSGDLAQDGVIDLFDYLVLEEHIINGSFGYHVSELSGDGVVDLFDFISFIGTDNLTNGIFQNCP